MEYRRITVVLTMWMWWCVGIARGEPPWLAELDTSARVATESVCTNIDIRNNVDQFKKLRNCTVVEGFVQILLIDNATEKDFENVSIPELREITGYLFLYRVQGLTSLSKLFPNLTVIRGNVLFYNYAFVIYELMSLHEIGLGSLTVIVRGSVRFDKNPHLCYVDTIDWDRIAKAGRGGHYFTDNKPQEQCPNTCPNNMECPVSSLSNGKQQKLCWNAFMCQKVCGSNCEHRNLTCSAKSHCCHRECLGGCSGNYSTDCIACKNVVYEGRCMSKCPPGTFEYLGRRCIQEAECRAIDNQLSIFPVVQPIYWKPFNGECLPHCPAGYMESESDRHKCRMCKDRCPKVCGSSVIDSVATAQKMKGCTFINGSLEIQIQGGGGNIITELENSLSSIREIRGYLKIARSFPLISLNFLKDLTHIRGESLDKKEYALLVLDNQNLQELWDWENRKTRLRIDGGKIFFHFNSKLCLNKINELKKYAIVKEWDDRDVSPSSNGDRVACNVTNMEISVWRLGAEIVGLKWPNFRKAFKDTDFRSLLGYVVYYREAPQKNITIFDGRDACGSDVWKVDDVEADDEGEEVITLLTRLKPFTTYAAYMRTYTIASAVLGAQSPIIYFTTKPSTPSPPVNVIAASSAQGEIVVRWKSPKNPNGNVTHYIVDGLLEKESFEFISQRNYCNEPLVIPDFKKTLHDKKKNNSEVFIQETASSDDWGQCCSCSKSTPLESQEDDAEFQIHFEDFLHNNVYIKNPNPNKRNRSSNMGSNLNKQFTTESSIDVFSTESSNMEFKSEDYSISESYSSTTTRASIENGTASINNQNDPDLRFHYVVQESFLVIKKLHHFTEYTIEVRACQDSLNDVTRTTPECSTQAITTVRTVPLGGADDIDTDLVKINSENMTTGVFIKWDEPSDPNGLIVAYHIEYKIADTNDYKTLPVCITQQEYKKQNGYTLTDLMPGNYSLRLRATSLAANGNWTKPVYFLIPNPQAGMPPEILAVIIVFVCLGIISAALLVAYCKWYKKKGVLYASVNPEYMSAGLVYEPDEWEVSRENIKFLGELGQGSFGMVYKGEATGLGNDPKGVTKCAIKTVNVSASVRERIEFLQEASVMKGFNCHHVVKLLGVVSKGHPTLVIMELMAKGDLKAYLRSHRPENNESTDVQPPTLKQILKMAIEIADGMAYLTAKKFVHRDLAARNCMVAEDETVKIGDFGMTRDIYETDYYRKGGKGLLPVRWMAPECLKDGIFSSQSDIWSYGIVLWEMATLASQPYQGLSNEQVLKYVISGGVMEKPENCPEKLYALMRLCWEHNPKARPTFTELIEILLPEVSQTQFREFSFYFTQRQELGNKENDPADAASSSTPLRIRWVESESLRNEPLDASDLQYFPSTRDVTNENYICNNPQSTFFRNSIDCPEAHASSTTAAMAANEGSKAYSIHSNEGSKGMSVTSSEGSKGSKVSSVSNGSIANGHLSFSIGRTTTC